MTNKKNISSKKEFIYDKEEEVKINLTLPWLDSLGYKKESMNFEQTIQVQEGKKKKSIFADIVIFADKKKETPLIVVDTKSPKEILSKSDRDQVISYARLMPKIAPIAILTNGHSIQIYQTIDKSRIKELPNKKELLKDFVSAVISKNIQDALREEATKELFIIDDVNTFKNLLKKCHNEIRNNEGYDPVEAFDELSKVMFAKMYEEQYHRELNRFTLKTFEDTLKKLNVNIVQQEFQEIQKIEKYKNLFPEGTIINLKNETIKEIVSIFERYDLTLTNFDVKGEAFEYFLSDTFTGGLGEFFTPRNVVEFMVEVFEPKIGQRIIDPFCGTGGFLIYAFDIVSNKIRLQEFSDEEKGKWQYELSNKSLFGTDWKPRTSQACKMNMIVHGDGNTCIFQHNGFTDVSDPKEKDKYVIENNKFDLCFTNPPFGATENDSKILNSFDLGKGRVSQKREILAIERCINLVKPKTGFIAIVLPDGILNNDSFSYVREYINKKTELLAVIGMNKETFEGYNATAKTSILFMRRKEEEKEDKNINVFMAVCTNSGYAPTGQQIAGNQLPDILFDLKSYLKNEKSKGIFKYSKIITIKDPSDRIDAERYISINEKETIDKYSLVSEDIDKKILGLVEKSKKIKEYLKKIYETEVFDYVLIDNLLKEEENYVNIDKDKQYVRLGVSGNGAGIFKKEAILGKEFKAKKLNFVKEGLFVYSRLFAKNGSFAVVKKEHNDGAFSNEFPTFSLKETKYSNSELLDYLVFYLSSPQVKNYIIKLTTGSTKESRGRFKEEQFLSMKIPIPKKPEILTEIVKSIRLINEFQEDITNLSNRMKELPISFKSALPEIV